MVSTPLCKKDGNGKVRDMKELLEPGRVIDILGGTSEVARMCNVSRQAVSQWRTQGIPRGHLVVIASRLERATGFLVTRRALFQDWAEIWPELANKV